MRRILSMLVLVAGIALGVVTSGYAHTMPADQPAACVVDVPAQIDGYSIQLDAINYIWYIPECASVPEVSFVTAEILRGYVPADYKPPEISNMQASNKTYFALARDGDTQILYCREMNELIRTHYCYRNPRDAI